MKEKYLHALLLAENLYFSKKFVNSNIIEVPQAPEQRHPQGPSSLAILL